MISIGRIDPKLELKFTGQNIHFIRKKLDLTQLAKDSDLAILNGNHTTTITMHLSNTPVLHLPLTLEQALNAKSTTQLGAGLTIDSHNISQLRFALTTLLRTTHHTTAAQRFATTHTHFNPKKPLTTATHQLKILLP